MTRLNCNCNFIKTNLNLVDQSILKFNFVPIVLASTSSNDLIQARCRVFAHLCPNKTFFQNDEFYLQCYPTTKEIWQKCAFWYTYHIAALLLKGLENVDSEIDGAGKYVEREASHIRGTGKFFETRFKRHNNRHRIYKYICIWPWVLKMLKR